MATLLLKARLALELPPINAALNRAARDLPEAVRPVAQHIFDAGGKRLRPLLTVLTARLCGYDNEDIYDLAVTLEMLHAATLLHDDVLDNAATRRGQPAAHTLFEVTPTILAGDALLSHANSMVADYGDPRLCRCFSEATSRTATGEILEIAAQRRVDTSAEAYEEIVRGKTAWLIRAACQMGALRAGAPDALVEAVAAYGENVGMAFQMVDDALDFAPESETGKPTGGDVREGKLTPPPGVPGTQRRRWTCDCQPLSSGKGHAIKTAGAALGQPRFACRPSGEGQDGARRLRAGVRTARYSALRRFQM